MKKLGKFLTILVCFMALAFTACKDSTEPPAPTTYTVTFNVNGGNGTVPAAQTVQIGSDITLPSGSGLSKSGYSFDGWNTKADGTGDNYDAGVTYTPTASIILYAKWDAVYTVTFDINGGNGTTPTTQIVDIGSNVTLPSGTGLTKSGYSFEGWNTKADGTGDNYDAEESYTPTASVTLYANWVVEFGILLNRSDLYTFTAATYGYATAPSELNVTVSNIGIQATGTLSVELSGTNANDFTLSTTSIDSIAAEGDDSFTVVPNTGLNASTTVYTATVTVSGENNIFAEFVISFTVNKASGAAVSAPTSTSSVTVSSITVNDVAAPINGQTVEYAVNTSNSAPSSGWQTYTTFSGLMYGTRYYIFARSAENTNYNTGTASSGYQVTTTTPAGTEDDPFPLTANLWDDGSIPASGEVWYSFYAAANTTYRVWWNQQSGGDDTKTISRVQVAAYNSDRTEQFNEILSTWDNPKIIGPYLSGTTIKLKVTSYYSDSGTFAIGYSASNDRSAFKIRLPASHTPLTANQWTNGEITTSNREVWYSFTATANTNYGVWWNDSSAGDGSKTLNAQVWAYDSNGTQLFNVDDSWTFNLTSTLNVASSGTIYLRVLSRYGVTSGIGTYGIRYNTGFVRGDIGVTSLTANQWANGTIGAYGETWYSFTVAANTTYCVWWNSHFGDNTKTAWVRVAAYNSDRTEQFNEIFGAWDSPRTIGPYLSGTTIYLRVAHMYTVYGDTFAIVYSTGSTRP